MAKDTKERILETALTKFSENGYAGTNIREITESLGLVKSSVYKHYAGKEEIWNALLDRMSVCYDERFASPGRLLPAPESLEELVRVTVRMADLTIRDENIVKMRRLLSIEQFRDDRARDLAAKHFLTGPAKMFTQIFAAMTDKKLFRRGDPAMLAFAYTAPISSLIQMCDREPGKTEWALEQIEAFSRHFIKTYGRQTQDGISIRRVTKNEVPAALALVWKVFAEYESPDYAPEGTEVFRKSLKDETYLKDIVYYGAFDGEDIVGVLGIRREKRHICFLFVDGQHHRCGIGTKLFKRMLEDFHGRTITLNSSPYGLPFYDTLGLTATGSEQTVDGIRFTPMEYKENV